MVRRNDDDELSVRELQAKRREKELRGKGNQMADALFWRAYLDLESDEPQRPHLYSGQITKSDTDARTIVDAWVSRLTVLHRRWRWRPFVKGPEWIPGGVSVFAAWPYEVDDLAKVRQACTYGVGTGEEEFDAQLARTWLSLSVAAGKDVPMYPKQGEKGDA